MKQGFEEVENIEDYSTDRKGVPTGGHVHGTGIDIRWQKGPLGRDGERVEPNGAFVEDVIEAARQRIAFFQEACGGRFRSTENAHAINALEEALRWLDSRTQRREAAGIEGTYQEDSK